MELRGIIGGLLLCMFSVSYSQTVNDISKIVLGVRFLDDISQETKSLQPQLEDKLIMFASQSGYSSFGSNMFFISPNIIINSIDVAEGGMKNIYVVQGELYLVIQDGVSGTIYSSSSFPFKGSATKKDTAIKNAVLNINYSKVQGVFSEAKEKILLYYEQQKDVIFTRAETCAKNGDYDEAIACLMMVPEELADLHIQALKKAQDIYNQRDAEIQQQKIAEMYSNNEAILTEANSFLAMHEAQEALKVLWNYRSGNEKQDSLYTVLVKKAEDLVSASELEALRKAERAYQDNKLKEEREWEEHTIETAHRRDMDKREIELKGQMIASAERVAHDQISAKKQEIAANERIAYHQANLDAQKIDALKAIACEYIRNNPNTNYIHVKY